MTQSNGLVGSCDLCTTPIIEHRLASGLRRLYLRILRQKIDDLQAQQRTEKIAFETLRAGLRAVGRIAAAERYEGLL